MGIGDGEMGIVLRRCLLLILGAALLLQSELWSDETISIGVVALWPLHLSGCGCSLRGRPLPFFVASHTEMVVDDIFAVFDIVRSLHIDAELGEVGA